MVNTNLVFGPVPSRRLGRSLGINHIPPKTCTYACVYCQLGQTDHLQIRRQTFYPPEAIVAAVKEKVKAAHEHGEIIDYLTCVPDGEPTLDLHLGALLAALKPLGIPLAVISNASCIGDPEVQETLLNADWVSLKMDAGQEAVWRQINRPHGRLRWADMQTGARTFAQRFQGTLATETMLVAGVNDAPDALAATAAAIANLEPDVAYLSIPTRPPAETWVHPPQEDTLNRAYQIFAARLSRVELLIGYEGNAFAATGDAAADLLSITAVHPMREDAVQALLARTGTAWDVVRRLIAQELVLTSDYQGQTFYLRNLTHPLQ